MLLPHAANQLGQANELTSRAESLENAGLLARADAARGRAHRHERAAADRLAPPTVMVPDLDGGTVQIPAITRASIAGWLHRVPAAVSDHELDEVLGPQEHKRVNAAWRAVRRSYHAGLDASDPTLRRWERQAAGAVAQQDRQLLKELLHRGLAQRLGGHLAVADEWLYVHLTARGLKVDGIRVCERCLLVFAGQRAARCLPCRRSPDRPRPKRWHTHVALADPAPLPATSVMVVPRSNGATLVISSSLRRAPANTTYSVSCLTCSASFQATDARQRYCPACATPAARTRRSRGRTDPSGR